MAFKLDLGTDKTIKVIVSKDNAIKGTSEEDYEKYLNDLDESHLKMAAGEEPTRFVLRKVLPYRDTKTVMNSQISFDEKTKKTQVNISFMMEEVRCALVGIEGPGGEQYKKDNDGAASKDIINYLYNAGVLMDLYNARKNANGEAVSETVKKS